MRRIGPEHWNVFHANAAKTFARTSSWWLLLGLLLTIQLGTAQIRIPTPPSPTRWVTDTAGFLSTPAAKALDTQLEQFERETTAQVLVYIATSVPPNVTLEAYATQCFNTWRVGQKGKDNGVIVFVFARDRKIRIEVGLGLEKILTNQRAKDIIEKDFLPTMRAGDADGAVSKAIYRVLDVVRRSSTSRR